VVLLWPADFILLSKDQLYADVGRMWIWWVQRCFTIRLTVQSLAVTHVTWDVNCLNKKIVADLGWLNQDGFMNHVRREGWSHQPLLRRDHPRFRAARKIRPCTTSWRVLVVRCGSWMMPKRWSCTILTIGSQRPDLGSVDVSHSRA
jgi:hypothetical protein